MLQQLIAKDRFTAVGLMSGTSMDGIDAALVRMGASDRNVELEVVAFNVLPYPDELRSSLRDVAYGENCTAEDVAVLNTSVAVAFSNAFYAVCRQKKVAPDDVDFIASHGQTVAHVPPSADGMSLIAGTLQLGPPGMIAAITGVTTVGDFRVGDVALGGQGAPLAPYVDFMLRRSREHDRIILNIGGIANVTYLPKNGSVEEVLAFDTGPGNMVLDELYRVLFPAETGYEKLNAHLARGRAVNALVEPFLGMAYFEQKPPKSAGHREFGGRFAWEFLSQAEAGHVKREDILASALSLATRSMHAAIRDFIQPIGDVDQVFVTGGGRHNRAMMDELAMMLAPAALLAIDELGVPADAKEAVDFAVLGREALLGRPNVFHHVTGAACAAVLGSIAVGRGA
jgi:anhydro-N-acetylmuramic acid kinase